MSFLARSSRSIVALRGLSKQTVGLRSISSLQTFKNAPKNKKTQSSGSRLAAAFLTAAATMASAATIVALSEEKKASPSTVLPSGLDPQNFVPLKLVKVEKYNHDTSVFYFALPAGPKAPTNLPVPSFLLVRGQVNGKEEIRPYTPIDQSENGYIKLLVKNYPEGKISSLIHNLKVGETLDIKGPLPKFKYSANYKKNIGMIAGGTGITPFLQVIEEIVKNPNDHTNVTLLFANKTESDILLKERLDAIVSKHKNIKVIYSLDKPPAGWNNLSGFITKDVIKQYLPDPSEGNQIYICGPPPMMKAFSGTKKSPTDQGEVEGVLKDLGFTKENVFKF